MQYQIVFVAARPVEAERQQSFFGRNLKTHVFRTFLSSEPPKRVVFVAAPLVEAGRKQRFFGRLAILNLERGLVFVAVPVVEAKL